MKRICSFAEYLQHKEDALHESGARRPSGKAGLYPLGYGGLGLYPPSTWLSAAADAILYVTADERLFDNGVGPPWPITHIPGPDPDPNPNSGAGGLFSIKHIPGPDPDPKFHKAGEGPPFSILHLRK